MGMTALLALAFSVQAPLQEHPKVDGSLTEAPGPRLVCAGTADVPDGVVFNIELFIDGRGEPLGRIPVRVKEGMFTAAFDAFKGCARNLPGSYRARVSYHPAFQPVPLAGVAAFHVFVPLKIGTPEEIAAAHKAVRDRLIADLKGFGEIGDDIRAAFEAAKGKVDPADWRKRTEGWKARCTAIEKRTAADPEYAALGCGTVTLSGTEYLREKVRGLVESGGAGREADLQVGREQLDGMIRGMILDLAPPGSTAAERRALIGQARGAAVSALDAEGPAFAACKKGFLEALLKLSVKAPPEARDALLLVTAQGTAYFDEADASRERARKLQPDLDRKLADVLQLLLKTE
jgi:hypothetical protein